MMKKITPYLIIAAVAVGSVYLWNNYIAPKLSSANPNPFIA